MIQLLRPPRELPYNRHVLRKDLRYCMIEGALFSLMIGLAETWFGAFYIAAGISTFSIGILATLPLLVGSLIQLATPWGIRRAGSYRVWSVMISTIQGLSLIALAISCGLGAANFWTIFLLMVIYRASSLAMIPAWNTWMEFVIPKRVRTRYLSCRMRVCQICLLSAVCAAGFMLNLFVAESAFVLFSGMFLLAGVLRIASAILLGRHTEQPQWIVDIQPVMESEQPRSTDSSIVRVVMFFAAMQFAVFVSGPFFTPFMLRSMGIDYWSFMFLIVLGYVGRVLTLQLAGEVARRWGTGRLLWLGSIGLIPLAGLWWFYDSFLFLIVIQLLGGVAWGFYELAMSLVFMELIPRVHRPRILSMFGLLNAVAMVGGSLVGGLVLQLMDNQVGGFMTVFLLSTVLRALSLALFPFALLAQSSPATTMPEGLMPAAPHPNGRPAMGSLASLASEASSSSQPAPYEPVILKLRSSEWDDDHSSNSDSQPIPLRQVA